MEDLYCSASLPSKFVFGLKELAFQSLKCGGWFLSPSRKVKIQVAFDTGESFDLWDFEPRDEVARLYPEYKQKGRGFSFDYPVPEDSKSFSFSLISGEEVLKKEIFLFKNILHDREESNKKSRKDMIFYEGKSYLPNGNRGVPLVLKEKCLFSPDSFSYSALVFSRVDLSQVILKINREKEIPCDFCFKKKTSVKYKEKVFRVCELSLEAQLSLNFENLDLLLFQKDKLIIEFPVVSSLKRKALWRSQKPLSEVAFQKFLNQELLF